MGDSTSRREGLFVAIGGLAPVLAALATIPVVQMGLNDDFSYNFIALRLAQTGHFHYDGWATTMIGVNAWWAALLIRLFGFSFTLVRLSTLPFAAGCGVLIYRLGRYTGLDSRLALFGSLVTTVSPLFIPLAASFMTDVPGLFFWLLSIFSALLAVRQTNISRAALLLSVCAAAGVAGGTVRQVVWIAPMVGIPMAAWIARRDRRFVAIAAAFWCVAGFSSFLCLHWFDNQPYVQLQEFSVSPGDVFSVDTLGSVARLAYGAVVFTLPVLLMFTGTLRKWREFRRGIAAAVVLMAAMLVAFITIYPGRTTTSNIVTSAGIMSSGTDVMGGKPIMLTPPVVSAIRVLMCIGGVAGLGFCFLRRPRISEARRWMVLICAPAAITYLGAVLYRSLDAGIMFDRYLFEVLPFAIVWLLAAYQDHIRPSVPAVAWACFALFAVYGVAVTHDAFAGDRARVKAADALLSAGIPRTRITAGFEYDGWTELETTGHINSDDIVRPADVYKPQDDRKYPVSPAYWFWSYTPSIQPEYFVSYLPIAGLRATKFAPVPFTAWLPPFRREALTEKTAGQ